MFKPQARDLSAFSENKRYSLSDIRNLIRKKGTCLHEVDISKGKQYNCVYNQTYYKGQKRRDGRRKT
jgi:hypothetical protein